MLKRVLSIAKKNVYVSKILDYLKILEFSKNGILYLIKKLWLGN